MPHMRWSRKGQTMVPVAYKTQYPNHTYIYSIKRYKNMFLCFVKIKKRLGNFFVCMYVLFCFGAHRMQRHERGPCDRHTVLFTHFFNNFQRLFLPPFYNGAKIFKSNLSIVSLLNYLCASSSIKFLLKRSKLFFLRPVFLILL